MIISGDQIEKRNQVSYFQVTISRKKNPLALRARILKLFWKGKKLKSLLQGINLKRGHQMRYFFLVTALKKNPLALRSRILKLFWMGKKLNSLFPGIKLKGGIKYFIFTISRKRKSARASRSYIKVVLEGVKLKIIISGDQFKKRASNSLFLRGHCIEKIRSRFALAY